MMLDAPSQDMSLNVHQLRAKGLQERCFAEPPPIICAECGQDHPRGDWGPCATGLDALKELGNG